MYNKTETEKIIHINQSSQLNQSIAFHQEGYNTKE